MAEIESGILLQIEDAGGTYRCRGFSGVPAARQSWICISSSDHSAAAASIRDLEQELVAELLSSSPEAREVAAACPGEPTAMKPEEHPNRRKLLVLVGAAGKQFQDLAWYNQWQSDKYDSAVMTALPPGEFKDMMSAAIRKDKTHLLQRLNAARWKTRAAEVLPTVLAQAQITSAATRIFISYRRVETLPIALQLFDRLVHEGFEVFLDRFSIPPGYDFQRRLNQELLDKSMVVLLESKHLKRSEWTQHEICFAKRNRLGMARLTMPDVTDDDAVIAATLGLKRTLKPEEFQDPNTKPVPDPDAQNKPVDQWQELKPEVLESVVCDIKSAHAKALFDRRRRLRSDVVAALQTAGVPAQYREVGPLVVANGGDEHLIWLTTRPPEVSDFQSVYAARIDRSAKETSRGLIVGPLAALEPDRHQRLEWLHTVSKCLSFDEGDLAKFADRVKTGQWK
jgi:hypothetical protein